MREPDLLALYFFSRKKSQVHISVISFFNLQLYRPWNVDFFAKKKKKKKKTSITTIFTIESMKSFSSIIMGYCLLS